MLKIARRGGIVQGAPGVVSSAIRHLSSDSSKITFDAESQHVHDIIDRSLDPSPKRTEEAQPLLLTTRREALSLYREIMRITGLFTWQDERGRPWRDVLRESARQEFEASRYEKNPETVNRLLVVGRDAVHKVAERFLQKHTEPAQPPLG